MSLTDYLAKRRERGPSQAPTATNLAATTRLELEAESKDEVQSDGSASLGSVYSVGPNGTLVSSPVTRSSVYASTDIAIDVGLNRTFVFSRHVLMPLPDVALSRPAGSVANKHRRTSSTANNLSVLPGEASTLRPLVHGGHGSATPTMLFGADAVTEIKALEMRNSLPRGSFSSRNDSAEPAFPGAAVRVSPSKARVVFRGKPEPAEPPPAPAEPVPQDVPAGVVKQPISRHLRRGGASVVPPPPPPPAAAGLAPAAASATAAGAPTTTAPGAPALQRAVSISQASHKQARALAGYSVYGPAGGRQRSLGAPSGAAGAGAGPGAAHGGAGASRSGAPVAPARFRAGSAGGGGCGGGSVKSDSPLEEDGSEKEEEADAHGGAAGKAAGDTDTVGAHSSDGVEDDDASTATRGSQEEAGAAGDGHEAEGATPSTPQAPPAATAAAVAAAAVAPDAASPLSDDGDGGSGIDERALAAAAARLRLARRRDAELAAAGPHDEDGASEEDRPKLSRYWRPVAARATSSFMDVPLASLQPQPQPQQHGAHKQLAAAAGHQSARNHAHGHGHRASSAATSPTGAHHHHHHHASGSRPTVEGALGFSLLDASSASAEEHVAKALASGPPSPLPPPPVSSLSYAHVLGLLHYQQHHQQQTQAQQGAMGSSGGATLHHGGGSSGSATAGPSGPSQTSLFSADLEAINALSPGRPVPEGWARISGTLGGAAAAAATSGRGDGGWASASSRKGSTVSRASHATSATDGEQASPLAGRRFRASARHGSPARASAAGTALEGGAADEAGGGIDDLEGASDRASDDEEEEDDFDDEDAGSASEAGSPDTAARRSARRRPAAGTTSLALDAYSAGSARGDSHGVPGGIGRQLLPGAGAAGTAALLRWSLGPGASSASFSASSSVDASIHQQRLDTFLASAAASSRSRGASGTGLPRSTDADDGCGASQPVNAALHELRALTDAVFAKAGLGVTPPVFAGTLSKLPSGMMGASLSSLPPSSGGGGEEGGEPEDAGADAAALSGLASLRAAPLSALRSPLLSRHALTSSLRHEEAGGGE